MATKTDETPISTETGKDTEDVQSSGGDVAVTFGGNTYHFKQQGQAYVPTHVTNAKGEVIHPSSRQAAQAFSELPKLSGKGGILDQIGAGLQDIGTRWEKGAATSAEDIQHAVAGKNAAYPSKSSDSQPTEKEKKAEAAAAKKAGLDKKSTTSTAESPYEQLADQQAQQYLAQIAAIEPTASGSSLWGSGGQTAQAVNNAVSELAGTGGTTVTGPGGQSIGDWLQGQLGSEQTAANDAGLPQAMANEGQAIGETSVPIAQAIQNTGQGNTQYLESAPYQQLLQELANETAYKAATSTGAGAFGATTKNTPEWLQQIFTNLQLPVPTTSASATGGLQAPTTVPTTTQTTTGGGGAGASSAGGNG